MLRSILQSKNELSLCLFFLFTVDLTDFVFAIKPFAFG
jgi:hypothetical protein